MITINTKAKHRTSNFGHSPSKSKRSHRAIALFFVFTFLNTLVPYNQLWANNGGPTAPEATAFEPVDATDMVNLLTGDMSYVLPLLNVPSPEGGYPLALSYHSGIAMEQEASWVGLGWSLNPGAVNRSVAGVPDDWRDVRKYSIINDPGGVSKSYSGGVSVGWGGEGMNMSLGLYASYTEQKAFGGENSYGFDIGVNGGISFGAGGVGLNIGGSVGLNGASVSAGIGTNNKGEGVQNTRLSIGAHQSFQGGGTSYSVSANYSDNAGDYRNGSVGISFNSKSGLGMSTTFNSGAVGGTSNLSTGLNFNNDNFGITIPIYFVNISFAYNRSRYWLYENDYTVYNGTLYGGNTDELLEKSLFDNKVGFDSYESLYKIDRQEQLKENNFINLGYDGYSVSGQGISGSMRPYILDGKTLFGESQMIQTTSFGRPSAGVQYYNPDASNRLSKQLDDNSNDIHFYFDNEYSSFLKVTDDGWETPVLGTNYNDILSFDTKSKSFNSSIGGKNGYNFSKKRMRKGNYIETYTNAEIIANSNLVLQPETNINRTSELFPKDGIGAYKITTTDGKTYHYSIPVYQREQFARSAPLDKNIETHFSEQQQFEPYATHWLLTGITGPDYIDNNNDNVLNDEDYGYWVSFDYGKWSDGFTWRTPSIGYEENDKTKTYSWGVKDVYYLDKIITRTHTALFIKSEREDNYSSAVNERDGNNPKVYEDIHIKSYIEGDDGLIYFNGVYDDISVPYPPTNYYLVAKHDEYIETKKQKSLKLDKVVLIKNEKLTLSKSNAQQSNSIHGGKIKIGQDLRVYWTGNGAEVRSKIETITNRQWQAQMYSNVLDQKDIEESSIDILENADKVIDFEYDNYSLAPNSSNSQSDSKGKLTLGKVHFKGKRGASVVPPYRFDYYNRTQSYSQNGKDDWGYYKNSPMNWSLNKITNSIGAVINIDYESDEFENEAAITSHFFDQNLELKFTGIEAGAKTVVFRNHRYNTPEQNIDFRDYFAVNQSAEIDVQYWLNPEHNGDHRNADVSSNCIVSAVSSNEITFALPTTSTNSFVRRDNNCKTKNWIFYRWYAEVVGNTSGFSGAYRDNDCGGPGNGNYKLRYRINSNNQYFEKSGGGIRVKELRVQNSRNNITTRYNYNVPGTNISSGITSYAPSKKAKEVKFISDLPSPLVMYEYVTVQNFSNDDKIMSTDVYKFDVLKPMSSGVLIDFQLGEILKVKTDQVANYQNVSIDNQLSVLKLMKKTLIDQTSNMGRLLSRSGYNSEGQLLSKTTNNYRTYDEIEKGLVQETFNSYKKVWSSSDQDQYSLTSSSRIKVPNVLKSTTTSQGGFTNTTYYDEHDFLTGQVAETRVVSSDGREYKTKTIPAYHINEYGSPTNNYNMGAKVDNATAKNMLTQTSTTLSQLKDGNNWKTISSGITTWSNDWDYRTSEGQIENSAVGNAKIWRKHKTFVWDGELDTDGAYVGYSGDDDGFNWSNPENQMNASWLNTSTINQYDHYSMSLEIQDINGNKASTTMGDNNSKIFAVANAGYNEMFYSGAEDLIENTNYFSGEVYKGANATLSDTYHTGSKAIQVEADTKAFAVKPDAGTYKISVWAHNKDGHNYANSKIKVENQSALISYNPFETVSAGDWVQLNFYVNNVSSGEEVYLFNSSGAAIYDDFRMLPVESSMTSYVYNEWDELSYMIGANNLATKYVYDDAGRLIETHTEVINDTGITGGFKKVGENGYNHKFQ